MEATHRKMEVEREERKEREANISSGGGQLGKNTNTKFKKGEGGEQQQ